MLKTYLLISVRLAQAHPNDTIPKHLLLEKCQKVSFGIFYTLGMLNVMLKTLWNLIQHS